MRRIENNTEKAPATIFGCKGKGQSPTGGWLDPRQVRYIVQGCKQGQNATSVRSIPCGTRQIILSVAGAKALQAIGGLREAVGG